MPRIYQHIKRNPDGLAYLHIWRTGVSYFNQKSRLFLPEWTNVQFSVLPYPNRGEIIYHDIRRSIPFPDASFDCVYALHIIEHLTPQQAGFFLTEVLRVLKPGGILRISTPDWEDIIRVYLKRLDETLQNESPQNVRRFQWAQLELADQMVRDKSGGLMAEAVAAGEFDPQYAKERYGDVFDEFFPRGLDVARPAAIAAKVRIKKSPADFIRTGCRFVESRIYRILRCIKEIFINGDPRQTGEINKWVYDRLSLKLILEQNGFTKYSVKTYKTSDIRGWERYHFDCSDKGDHPIEPSLYTEARKP